MTEPSPAGFPSLVYYTPHDCHASTPGNQPLFYGRQLPHEFHGPLNPAIQLLIVLDAFPSDQNPALYRPARPNLAPK
jgi:hypothetical protein